MEKLAMHTKDKSRENFKKLAELFPNAVTETVKDGKIVRAIDKDVLMQEISAEVVEGKDERYQFTWPDKKKAVLLANAPTTKTLRPCKEESVNFDSTKNLYIEGDNLEVLKLLQETYLGRVKMIYIDPPYNTGKDSFVYDDKRITGAEEYKDMAEAIDEDGNLIYDFKGNPESNGYFHTDWLNMMYPRLRLARDLLTDDGVIFISIDDNEVVNLRKICDEIFGEVNFTGLLPTIMNLKGNNDEFGFAGTHEFTLVYMKNKESIEDLNGISLTPEDEIEYDLSDEFGKYKQGATLMRTGEAGAREKRPKGFYPIYVSNDLSSLSIKKEHSTDIEVYPITKNGKEMSWRRSPDNLMETKKEFIIKQTPNGITFYKKQRLEEDKIKGKKAKSLFYKPDYSSGNGTALIKELFGNRYFDNPKPLLLIKDFIMIGANKDDIIFDFFSGSATTAHAVMQLNAEDRGKRQFIMVQLPEVTDENSEAYKAGYKNICEIGKERIRRAGKKILADNNLTEKDLDIGFRVLKLDSTNMKDVYYTPAQYQQSLLQDLETNIKEDRTAQDLLFQVLLDLGIELSCQIETKTIQNKTLYNVNADFLIACFDTDLSEEIITEIAKQKPQYAVFRDNSFSSDITAVNFEQIFKTYSPDTIKKVL